MSAYLGPIHYWLYNKIQLQLDLVEELMTLGTEELNLKLEQECNERYGVSEKRPLEVVIDNMNIHAWLQKQVSGAEYKLAYCVNELIKKDDNVVNKLEEIFEQKGKEKRRRLECNLSVAQLYKEINDTLLDGMPCDHANTILEQGEQSIIWERNKCVHKTYWDEVEGDIKVYYQLREAWLKGFMSGEKEVFEKLNEVTYALRKEDENE